MSIENTKVVYKRYERSVTPEQMRAIHEYSRTLTSAQLLEYKLFDKTVAFDIEIDKEHDVIRFSIWKYDYSINECEGIDEIINIFISESLDPEMYM